MIVMEVKQRDRTTTKMCVSCMKYTRYTDSSEFLSAKRASVTREQYLELQPMQAIYRVAIGAEANVRHICSIVLST
jgi:hypothetical protein